MVGGENGALRCSCPARNPEGKEKFGIAALIL
jgi:hypothetical protein